MTSPSIDYGVAPPAEPRNSSYHCNSELAVIGAHTASPPGRDATRGCAPLRIPPRALPGPRDRVRISLRFGTWLVCQFAIGAVSEAGFTFVQARYRWHGHEVANAAGSREGRRPALLPKSRATRRRLCPYNYHRITQHAVAAVRRPASLPAPSPTRRRLCAYNYHRVTPHAVAAYS